MNTTSIFRMRNIIFRLKLRFIKTIRKNNNSLRNIRPSSYPYISGDTFRSISDFIIESRRDVKVFSEMGHQNSNINIVFISAGFLDKYNEKNLLNSFNGFEKSNKILIIHNGDYVPDIDFLNKISNKFSKVFCVNLIKKSNNIYPIPIGLENLYYLNNGITSNFSKYRILMLQEKLRKNNLVFASFNVGTNPCIRSAVLQDIYASRFNFEIPRLSSETYLKNLSKSYFCISPPGNGADCHRTWEAIYLGAIPVVLKGFLADEFISELPILEVESYRDFFAKSNEELLEIYSILKAEKKLELAFFNYWQNKIFN